MLFHFISFIAALSEMAVAIQKSPTINLTIVRCLNPIILYVIIIAANNKNDSSALA